MSRFGMLLIVVVVLGAVTGTAAQERQITAREVVADIQKQVGVEWDKNTVDTFKAGNPDATVTGIAVTMNGDDGCSAACIGPGIEFRHHP
jgi:hypothetical protein